MFQSALLRAGILEVARRGIQSREELPMIDFSKMARAAARRRKSLEKELERARAAVDECAKELGRIDAVLDALGGGGGRRGGATRGRRKGGRWRPGRPGRPPNWWIEQQKKKGAKPDGRKKGRRGRRRGRTAPPPAA
jgi:hypothetical protein